jgi:hypothetical protein
MNPQPNQSNFRKSGVKKGKKAQNQQSGGAGGADHLLSVVGNTHSQVAQLGRGNEIQTAVSGQNPDLGGSSATVGNGMYSGSTLLGMASPYKGGKKRSLKKGKGKKSKKGGNILAQLAVPALYVYANNTFGKRKSSGRKTRRFRRSRRSGRK